jgi:hypothetical protein
MGEMRDFFESVGVDGMIILNGIHLSTFFCNHSNAYFGLLKQDGHRNVVVTEAVRKYARYVTVEVAGCTAAHAVRAKLLSVLLGSQVAQGLRGAQWAGMLLYVVPPLLNLLLSHGPSFGAQDSPPPAIRVTLQLLREFVGGGHER